MPKVVDHDQRRLELAEAVLRIVLRDGVSGATVRAVAAEAGWSTGALRYYFASQDELRLYAAEVAWMRLRHRIETRLATRQADLPVLELAAQVIEELIPLDEERREEYSLWMALADWERGRPAAERSPMWETQRGLSRDIVALLAGEPLHGTFDERVGVAHPDPRVESWAEFLHVFTDGLASQAMLVPHTMPPARVRSVLLAFLGEVPNAVYGVTGSRPRCR